MSVVRSEQFVHDFVHMYDSAANDDPTVNVHYKGSPSGRSGSSLSLEEQHLVLPEGGITAGDIRSSL